MSIIDENLKKLSADSVACKISQVYDKLKDINNELCQKISYLNDELSPINFEKNNYRDIFIGLDCFVNEKKCFYSDIIKKYDKFKELYRYSINNQPKQLSTEIDYLYHKLNIAEKINGYATFSYNNKPTELKKLEKKLEEINKNSIENPHLYTIPYLTTIGNAIKKIAAEIDEFKKKEKIFTKVLEDLREEVNKQINENEKILLRNEYLTSWNKAIKSIREFIPKNDNDFDMGQPASYLFYLLFSGKLSFKLSDYSTHINRQILSKSYSFKKAYDNFLSSSNGNIYLNELSPQILPKSKEKVKPIEFNTFSESFVGLTRELEHNLHEEKIKKITSFTLGSKVDNNSNSLENWTFSVKKENAFEISQLPYLARAIKYDDSLDYEEDALSGLNDIFDEFKHWKPLIETKLNIFNTIYGTSIVAKTFNSQFDLFQDEIKAFTKTEELRIETEKSVDKCNKFNCLKLLYTVAFDSDLKKHKIKTNLNINMYEFEQFSHRLNARTAKATNNEYVHKLFIYLIEQPTLTKIKKKSNTHFCFFPFCLTELGEYDYPSASCIYDSSFSSFYDFVNDILIENNMLCSYAWGELFYLFLYSQGLTFSRSSISGNMILIPVMNDKIFKFSENIYADIKSLSDCESENKYCNSQYTSFFKKICFDTEEISKFISEESIKEYFLKPYNNSFCNKLKTLDDFKPHQKPHTQSEEFYLILKNLVSNINTENICMSLALLSAIFANDQKKGDNYIKIFCDSDISFLLNLSYELNNNIDKIKNHNNADQALEHITLGLNTLSEKIKARLDNSKEIVEILKKYQDYIKKYENTKEALKENNKIKEYTEAEVRSDFVQHVQRNLKKYKLSIYKV